ncbi:uncharacterized protein LOC135169004 [Diachasmimorpha longicaudata]|uniref:uncharacterized protein LOC135169004 n=1 Tax=Diachasmimorpha longicaudata TaxID=58733 RepID=UPI0030B8D514
MIIHNRPALITVLISCIQWVPSTATLLMPDHVSEVQRWSSEFLNFLATGSTRKNEVQLSSKCSQSTEYQKAVLKSVCEQIIAATNPVESGLKSSSKTNDDASNENFQMPETKFIEETNLFENLYITDIPSAYKIFIEKLSTIAQTGSLCDSSSSEEFDYNGMTKELSKIYAFILPADDARWTLQMMVEHYKDRGDEGCDTEMSTSRFLYLMHNQLLRILVKGFVMKTFVIYFSAASDGSEETCGYKHKNNHQSVLDDETDNFLKAVEFSKDIFSQKIKSLSRDFRRCDNADSFVRYESFLELEGLYQGILQLSTDANIGILDNSDASCQSLDTKNGPPALYCDPETKFCAAPKNRACRGRVWQCKSYPYIEACEDPHGPRRYTKVRTSKNQLNCDDFHRIRLDFPSGSGACLCKCQDNDKFSPSTHIISLLPVESDVANNMVITGIKFVVRHGILQFQIQQGRIDRYWQVYNVTMKPIDDKADEISAKRQGLPVQTRDPPPNNWKQPTIRENEDFLIITIDENNGINFDDLQVPSGYVLTGVRFILANKPEEKSPKRVEISVIGTQYNPLTGNLCATCEPAIVKSDIIHREKYPLSQYPIEGNYLTTPNSKEDQYVVITTSSMEEDGGQTTLPLFDALPLLSQPPAALAGLGLFHKTSGSFTGLVSLKLFDIDRSIDMQNIIHEVVPDDNDYANDQSYEAYDESVE